MRVLRAYLFIVAIFILCVVLAPVTEAFPQQSAAPPATKSSVAAPPKSNQGGWDPDWGPKKVRPAQAAVAFTGPYAPGEVFVSDETGLVDIYLPNGTLLGTLDSGQSLTAGMAFDRLGNLYVTTFSGLENTPAVGVVKFGIDGNLIGPFGAFPAGAAGTAFPESILFNQAGDAYVGAATATYGCPSGSVNAYEFSATGTLLDTLTVMGQCRGTDWVELLPDQKTLLYTSEGTSVFSYNTSTNTQNADFADNLPGEVAYAFRVLPNGDLLVADTTEVVELNPSGVQVMTYTPNPASDELFALNLDPDGTSFWTADLATGNVYRFDIASGTQLITFTTPSGGASGVAIFGEKLVGQNNVMVTDAGTGTGTVTSTPAGISCPSSCLAAFPDHSNVTLTATAAAGSTFAGFSSNCVPAVPQTNPPSCTIPIVTSDVTVTATFNGGTGVAVSVTEAGTGSGAVSSAPAGITCPSACSADFASGTHVTLTATPAAGSSFAGWSGGTCTGTSTCTFTITAATTVIANFNSGTAGNFTLTVTEAGDGTGTVTSVPAGITCPTTCSASYASGTQVTLTPSPAEGSSFGGWSGACSGQSPCVVTMTAAKSVTATFNLGTSVIITIPAGGSTTSTTTPGGVANYGLLITGAPGVTGVVTLGCTASTPTISCTVIPSTVTLTGGTTEVAFSIQTYCQGATPFNVEFGPGGTGTLLRLLLLSTLLCGGVLMMKRDRRVALTFAVLTLMTVAMGTAACGNLAKGPNGVTPAGTYTLTLTATFNGQTQTLPNFLTLVVK
jgi:hypothetical protein